MEFTNLKYLQLGKAVKLPSYIIEEIIEELKTKSEVELSDNVCDLIRRYIDDVYDKAYLRGFVANNDREINYVIDQLDVIEVGLVAYYKVIHLVKDLLSAVQKCAVYNSKRHYK